jgi:transposase-like protein
MSRHRGEDAQPALLIQATGSAYVAALARLAEVPDESADGAARQGHEACRMLAVGTGKAVTAATSNAAERETDVGLTTAKRQRLKELEREKRESRRATEILRTASAYFHGRSSTADRGYGVVH